MNGDTLHSLGIINLPIISHTAVPLSLPPINVASNAVIMLKSWIVNIERGRRKGEVEKVGIILDLAGIES